MAKLVWDDAGKHLYETGVKMGVFYPLTAGTYPKGYVWNGLSTVTESPSGAEANDQYADDIKYISIRSAEEFGATIECFTFPDEFMACDGLGTLAEGVTVGQQSRKPFGFCYRTVLGNDTELNDYGYKLHLIYNATASPSEKEYSSINDSPEAIAFSYEITTTPINVTGLKPTAKVEVDSTKVSVTGLAALEKVLYGEEGVGGSDARLPLPDEVKTLVATV